MKRWAAIAAMAVLVAATGFLREFIFVSINLQLKQLLNPDFDYPLPQSMAFLEMFDYWPLYWSKWFLTALFCVIFFGETLLLLRLVFKKWTVKPVLFFYGMLVGLAIASFLIGWIAEDIQEGYLFSRFFLGLLQSPFPVILMVPALLLKER